MARFFFSLFGMIVLLLLASMAQAEVGDSYLKKGNDYYHAGQWDQAISQYQMALRLNPEHLRALHNLGLAYQSKKDFDHAIATFKQILNMDPIFVPGYISLGLVYAQKGSYQDAERQYAEALRLQRDNLIAHLNMAAVLAKQKKYDKAIRAAKRGLQCSPSSPHLHMLLGNIYFVLEKYSLAAREVRILLAAQPETLYARLMLAEALAYMGQFEKALEQIALAKKIQLDPGCVQIAEAKILALRFKKTKKGWKEAVDRLRSAAQIAPDNMEIAKELGDILTAKGQVTEARTWYQRLQRKAKSETGKHANISSKL